MKRNDKMIEFQKLTTEEINKRMEQTNQNKKTIVDRLIYLIGYTPQLLSGISYSKRRITPERAKGSKDKRTQKPIFKITDEDIKMRTKLYQDYMLTRLNSLLEDINSFISKYADLIIFNRHIIDISVATNQMIFVFRLN